MAKGRKTGGRQKGTPNKLSASFRQSVLEAFEELGGTGHLVAWARKNPTEYYRIAARLIPTELVGNEHQPVAMKVVFGGRYRPDSLDPPDESSA
jgi:hypothetical protein